MSSTETATCRYCGRPIINVDVGIWIDPEATGDDAIWSEVCDAHDTFEAEHEPALVPLTIPTPGCRMGYMSTDITITVTSEEGQALIDLIAKHAPVGLEGVYTALTDYGLVENDGSVETGAEPTERAADPNWCFQMYTPAGNAAVARLVGEVANAMRRGDVSRRGLPALLHAKVVEVAASHPEVHDTEPEWAIVDELNPVCDDLGWRPIGRDDL